MGVAGSTLNFVLLPVNSYAFVRVFDVSLRVSPQEFVEGDVIGAGRWYVFEAVVYHEFGGLSSVSRISLYIVDSSSTVLVNATCVDGECSSGGSIGSSVQLSGSGNKGFLSVNTTLPWSVSGRLVVRVEAEDFLGSRVSREYVFHVVNTVETRIFGLKEEYDRGERVVVRTRTYYNGTRIPAIYERQVLRVLDTAIVVETRSGRDGVAEFVFRAPMKSGYYTLAIDPEHGPTVYARIHVSEKYGGKPLVLETTTYYLLISIVIALIPLAKMLYRTRHASSLKVTPYHTDDRAS